MIVYPVKISFLGLLKLKKEGINYTIDPKEARKWIKNIEYKQKRDFGGIMVKNFTTAIK